MTTIYVLSLDLVAFRSEGQPLHDFENMENFYFLYKFYYIIYNIFNLIYRI